MTSRYQQIRLVKNVANGIWSVQLNRPDRLNALSEQMGEELISVFTESNQDPTCRGLLVHGGERTRAFSSGRDLKLSKAHTEQQAREYLDIAIESVLALYRVQVPTCAAIDGHCIGWGLELAMAADVRFVGPTARLRLPETSLGLFPGAGGIVLLPRIVGETKAKELILSAREVNAKEAIEIGLASPLSLLQKDDENHHQINNSNETNSYNMTTIRAAEMFLEKCAENAPLAVKSAKKTLRELSSEPKVEVAVQKSRFPREELSKTWDHREALNAFAEKRKPIFKGQ